MRLKKLKNQWRCYLNPTDYARLRACAESREAHLAVRLGGECGLRVRETTDAKPRDLRDSTADPDAIFLRVEGKDTTGELEGGKYRDTFVPPQLYKEIQNHVHDNEISPDEDIVSVVKRTTQAYIKRAAETAANRYHYQDYAKISSHDLRAYWATNMLVRLGVDENVVMAMGGWVGRDTMEPYINAAFDDIIIPEMQRVGVA